MVSFLPLVLIPAGLGALIYGITLILHSDPKPSGPSKPGSSVPSSVLNETLIVVATSWVSSNIANATLPTIFSQVPNITASVDLPEPTLQAPPKVGIPSIVKSKLDSILPEPTTAEAAAPTEAIKSTKPDEPAPETESVEPGPETKSVEPAAETNSAEPAQETESAEPVSPSPTEASAAPVVTSAEPAPVVLPSSSQPVPTTTRAPVIKIPVAPFPYLQNDNDDVDRTPHHEEGEDGEDEEDDDEGSIEGLGLGILDHQDEDEENQFDDDEDDEHDDDVDAIDVDTAEHDDDVPSQVLGDEAPADVVPPALQQLRRRQRQKRALPGPGAPQPPRNPHHHPPTNVPLPRPGFSITHDDPSKVIIPSTDDNASDHKDDKDSNDRTPSPVSSPSEATIPYHDILKQGRSVIVPDPTKVIRLPTPTGIVAKKEGTSREEEERQHEQEVVVAAVEADEEFKKQEESKHAEKVQDPVSALEKWIEETTNEQCKILEGYLYAAVEEVLDGQKILEFQDIIESWQVPLSLDDDESSDAQQAKDEEQQATAAAGSSDQQHHQSPLGYGSGGASNMKAVSRIDILSSILNTLLPPLVLTLRADIRNLIIWFCNGALGNKIDNNNKISDQELALRQQHALEEDRQLINATDGSISLVHIFDPKAATFALECLKSFFNLFSSAIIEKALTRFTEAKEFLMDQLRGLIGLPRFLIPFSEGHHGESGAAHPGNPASPITAEKLEQAQEQDQDQDQDQEQEQEQEQEITVTDNHQPLKEFTLQHVKNIQRTQDFMSWLIGDILSQFRGTLEAAKLFLPGTLASKVDEGVNMFVPPHDGHVVGVHSVTDDDSGETDDAANADAASQGSPNTSNVLSSLTPDGRCHWMTERVKKESS
ncbi:hypothetical protein BGZ94_008284 [Podila epigama]|nr:hypothetical protein BGZ94_008284 [Podila epigama]